MAAKTRRLDLNARYRVTEGDADFPTGTEFTTLCRNIDFLGGGDDGYDVRLDDGTVRELTNPLRLEALESES